MSTVDESLRHDIKKFEQERAEIKKEYERKKQMLTKAREDLIGKEEEPKEEAAFEFSCRLGATINIPCCSAGTCFRAASKKRNCNSSDKYRKRVPSQEYPGAAIT